eukprot:3597681-Pleurochrysis_carterae.AAC.1
MGLLTQDGCVVGVNFTRDGDEGAEQHTLRAKHTVPHAHTLFWGWERERGGASERTSEEREGGREREREMRRERAREMRRERARQMRRERERQMMREREREMMREREREMRRGKRRETKDTRERGMRERLGDVASLLRGRR